MATMSSANLPSGTQRFWALNWKLKLLVLVIFPVTVFCLGLMLADMFNFSVGERTGILSKLSTKGIACWTMEGELAQPNFSKSTVLRSKNDTVDNTFYFSVPDEAVRKQLQDVPLGSSVSLQYQQKLFVLDLPLPMICRRRTQFEITGVRLAPAFQPGGVPARPIE